MAANTITHWLDGLGLGQYASVFAENDINWEILPDLEDRDLEKLGLTLGHRKKLLKAIAALSKDAGAVDHPAKPTAASPPAGQ